jgi:N-acetyl-alpha-D-muramate 1-phosphate uridylyltransferase
MEGRDHGGALETAGGIAKALPLLADSFWVVSGDVLLPGFMFDELSRQSFAQSPLGAQLWLAPNAPHHPQGDFGISPQGLAVRNSTENRTWASVGLFKAELFRHIRPGTRVALRPVLEQALDAGRLGAVPWDGGWIDVGTPERLQQADAVAQRMTGA